MSKSRKCRRQWRRPPSSPDSELMVPILFLSTFFPPLFLLSRWYYRNINRQDAEAMLQPETDGCFVVRPGRQVGTFVLSVK